MIVTCQGYFDTDMNIVLINPGKLSLLKSAHKKGEAVQVVYSDEEEAPLPAAFRAFHALRDQYANLVGLKKDYAKALLKYRYGVAIPYMPGFTPPVEWSRCRFLEVEGRIVCLKSTTCYTLEELNVLNTGTSEEIASVENRGGEK